MKRQSVLALIMVFLMVTGTTFADLSSGLIANYHFSGNANDASGYAQNGIVYGATLTIDRFGNPDSAYSFDGVDDYIDFGSVTPTLFDSGDSFTLAAWIKHAHSSTLDYILARHDDNSGTFNYGLAIYNNKVALVADQAYVNSMSATSGISLADDLWYHIVGVYDNKNMTMYVNGTQVGTAVFPAGGIGDSTASLYVGKTGLWSGYPDDRYFHGVIDEVRIYNRALTGSEVYDLSIIPLPPAVILGSLGLTFSGWLLKKQNSRKGDYYGQVRT